VSEATPSLEDLLERRLPSALSRHDDALASAGIGDSDVAATKNALAAVALATTSPAAPPPSLRDRLLASRNRTGSFGVFADRIARLFDIPVADAEALMARIEKPDAWTPFLVEGLEMIPVAAGPKCAGAIATLVRIQPGATFPEHAHRGDETMFVLDGGFREPSDDGEEAWRGDEVFRADGTEHALVAFPGVPCIAAVVIVGHADFR
jgi:putative transcriptional regulator